MVDDFCATSEYAELIESWRASKLIATKLFALAGWPATLDLRLPLGPALPNRPHHLHLRHEI